MLYFDTYIIGTLVVYPVIGSMLGGEEVLIRGPCFDANAEVICKFGETEIEGRLVSERTASCITPTLFVAGRIPFTVSVDGGETYDFEGVYTMSEVFFILVVTEILRFTKDVNNLIIVLLVHTTSINDRQ